MILNIWNEREKVETMAPTFLAGESVQMVVVSAGRGPSLGGRLCFILDILAFQLPEKSQIVTWIYCPGAQKSRRMVLQRRLWNLNIGRRKMRTVRDRGP